MSEFGGPAWTWDAGTQQYYCHSYLAQQPDLNWRNPEVRAEMLEVLAFWLDRGVDGFRVDAIHHVIKDDQYRDNPPNPDYRPGQPPHQSLIRLYTTDRPEVHDVIAEMRAVVDRYPDRVLIGEAYLPLSRLMSYYGVEPGRDSPAVQFPSHSAPSGRRPCCRRSRASTRRRCPRARGRTGCSGNHDRSRIASRVGIAQARVAAMLLLTLARNPDDVLRRRARHAGRAAAARRRCRIPWEKNVPGLGLGRDPERTPMQWSSAPNAGFSTARPWLPVADDFRIVNVESERTTPGSMLTFYRALIALRRRHPALSIGSYAPLDLAEEVFSYRRDDGDDHVAVLLNLTSDARRLALPAALVGARPMLSTHPDRALDTWGRELELAADEGVIVAIANGS